MKEPKVGLRGWLALGVLVASLVAFSASRPEGGVRTRWDEIQEARQRKLSVAARWGEITEGPQLHAGQAQPMVAVFTNYECPHCRIGDRFITALMDDSPELGVVVRPVGFSAYPESTAAAVAALCAAEQGDFPAMHRQLFASTEWRLSGDFAEEARQAGVGDLEVFSLCMEREDVWELVRKTWSLAKELGVSGTPGYVFPSGVVRMGSDLDELGRELGL